MLEYPRELVQGDTSVAFSIVPSMTEVQREAVTSTIPSLQGMALSTEFDQDSELERSLHKLGLVRPSKTINEYRIPPTLTTTGLKVRRHLMWSS